MPSQVLDIKQFIEICRRKDASCAFFLPVPTWRLGLAIEELKD